MEISQLVTILWGHVLMLATARVIVSDNAMMSTEIEITHRGFLFSKRISHQSLMCDHLLNISLYYLTGITLINVPYFISDCGAVVVSRKCLLLNTLMEYRLQICLERLLTNNFYCGYHCLKRLSQNKMYHLSTG